MRFPGVVVSSFAILTLPVFYVLATHGLSFAGHMHSKDHYQVLWCLDHAGQSEVYLDAETFVDCLTSSHAVRLDFAQNWPDTIGRSLYYSSRTGKRAGIVLIMEKEADSESWLLLNNAIRQFGLPIDTWEIRKTWGFKYPEKSIPPMNKNESDLFEPQLEHRAW